MIMIGDRFHGLNGYQITWMEFWNVTAAITSLLMSNVVFSNNVCKFPSVFFSIISQ
jgi:hypothetical protein